MSTEPLLFIASCFFIAGCVFTVFMAFLTIAFYKSEVKP